MTPRRVVTSARADEDIESAIEHYVDSGAVEAAETFLDSLQAVRDAITEFPSIGAARFAVATGIPGLRDLAVRDFPYVMFYSDDADAVRIHRVLHSRRDIPSVFSDGNLL